MNPERTPRPQAPTLPFPEAPDLGAEAEGVTETQCNNGNKNGPWWDYCPNCSAPLVNRKCKYVCTRCHYHMSCSDFD